MDPLWIAHVAELGARLVAAAVVSLIGFVEPGDVAEGDTVQAEQVSSIETHRALTVGR